MKVSILGSYGEGNLGDEAILAGIMNSFNDTEFVIFSHNPKQSNQIHPGNIVIPVLPAGIRSYIKQFLNGDLKKSIKLLKDSYLIIIGGGGIFYDSKFSKGRNPIKVWHSRAKLLQRLNLAFELYAVGVSKFSERESKKLMKEICVWAHKVSVRDQGSKQNLIDIGVEREIDIMRDPAFNFPAQKKAEFSGFNVGISLRKWQKEQAYFTEVLDQLQSINKANLQIKLIPMSIGSDDDRIILSEFKAWLPESLREKTELIEVKTPQEAYQVIAGLDLLIAMRLHSLIFAKLAKVRYIPLIYDEKVRNVLNHS